MFFITVGKRKRPKNYTVINNYRFVISSQSADTYYLKCANFRKSCRARAIIRKDSMTVQVRDGTHNHPKHLPAKTIQIKREYHNEADYDVQHLYKHEK